MRISLSETFIIKILIHFSLFLLFGSTAHPDFFFGGGGDPEAKYNFYFILKIMLLAL